MEVPLKFVIEPDLLGLGNLGKKKQFNKKKLAKPTELKKVDMILRSVLLERLLGKVLKPAFFLGSAYKSLLFPDRLLAQNDSFDKSNSLIYLVSGP